MMRPIYRRPVKTRIKPKPASHKVFKQTFPWLENISATHIDNLNELLRMNKRKVAVNNDTWRLIPKDSCEIHKSRQKRNRPRRKHRVVTKRRRPGVNSNAGVRFKRQKSGKSGCAPRKRQNDKRSDPLSSSSCCSRSSCESHINCSSAYCSSDSKMEYE